MKYYKFYPAKLIEAKKENNGYLFKRMDYIIDCYIIFQSNFIAFQASQNNIESNYYAKKINIFVLYQD